MAMVLCDRAKRRPMTDYGIQIPILGSNGDRTIEALLADSDLRNRQEEWLVTEELPLVDREALVRVHDPAYVDRLLSPAGGPQGPCEREIQRTFELVNEDGSFHRYDPDSAKFDLCTLRNQSLRLAGGTTRGAEYALDHPDRFCFYLGGGMHHGQYGWGEGFCPVNDLVIAIRTMQSRGRIRTAWVVDVDAHKGDGTAALTRDDDTIHTLSIHMARGWPLDLPQTLPDGTPNPCHIPSTVDIPVASGEEETYVDRLKAGMAEMEATCPAPDFVLVVDGADPYQRDQLPSAELLKMSAPALLERDTFLYQWVRQRNVPALFVMAGNYGYHSWEVYTQFLERQLTGKLEL
jgi:acetoin utilization deacetylase AcuC-like enzyme